MKTTPKKAISKGAKSKNKSYVVRWLELTEVSTVVEAKSAKAALQEVKDGGYIGGQTEGDIVPLNQSFVCEEEVSDIGIYDYEEYVDRLVKSSPEYKGISEQLLSIINNEGPE